MLDVLKVACTQLGVVEQGCNITPYGEWYGKRAGENWNGQPWCAMFVSWCYAQSGQALPELQAPKFSGFASADLGRTACRQRGWVVDDPRPGDIVFFGGIKKARHVGLVMHASRASGQVVTIEGNTSGPMGKDGVFIKLHVMTEPMVFARPRFGEVSE